MKKVQKKKQQQNKISALKKECQFLLQQKRNVEVKLEKSKSAIGEINTIVNALLISIVLAYGKDNVLDIPNVDVSILSRYDIKSIRDENTKGYILSITEK